MASCIYSVQQLKNKKFNSDLLNKINFYIQVPSIRQRSEDIKELLKNLSDSCKIYEVNDKKLPMR